MARLRLSVFTSERAARIEDARGSTVFGSYATDCGARGSRRIVRMAAVSGVYYRMTSTCGRSGGEGNVQRQDRAISVVIPVYNSAATLPALLARLTPVLASLGSSFSVILVTDGSRDASWTTIVELAPQYPFLRGINLMRNFGQHNALLAGIRAAQYPITVTMSDGL